MKRIFFKSKQIKTNHLTLIESLSYPELITILVFCDNNLKKYGIKVAGGDTTYNAKKHISDAIQIAKEKQKSIEESISFAEDVLKKLNKKRISND